MPRVNPRIRPVRSSHHVCFSCRKAFKKPADVVAGGIALGLRRYLCPQCQRELTPLGKNFRAPKQRDLKAWRAAQILVRAGVTFDSSGTGAMPTNPKDALRLARDLLESRGQPSGDRLLKRWTKPKPA